MTSRRSLEDVVLPLRQLLSVARRSNRTFRRFSRTLDYLPADVEQPIGGSDFIICGSPRTGTTMLAAQLFQPPTVVSVVEPWDGLRQSPTATFRQIRDELQDGVLRSGRLDIDAIGREGTAEWTANEEDHAIGRLTESYQLGIKWPTWWQYLDRMDDASRFVVCIRDPSEVIASYRATGGSLRRGLDYPTAMNRDLNDRLRRTRHLALRRVLLYQAINERILPHLGRPNVFTVRYERWWSEPDRLRLELSDFLGIEIADWPVAIKPVRPRQPDEALLALIREHAPSAVDLGYSAAR